MGSAFSGFGFGKNLRASHATEKVFFSDYRSFERKVKASFVKWANGQHRDTRILGVENTEAKSELGCISVLEDVFSIHKALGVIPSAGGCTLTCTCVHMNMHRNPHPKKIILKVRGGGKGNMHMI